MIPKIIHYCWLSGDEKPDSIIQCITSWKRHMPDYQIKCWDSKAFESIDSRFASEAFDNKKWQFASDYIRLYALYKEGGIYLDADVLALGNIDTLLDCKFFSGLEMRDKEHSDIYLEAAVMGAEKGNHFIGKCLEIYNSRTFIKDDGTFDMTPIPTIISPVMEALGWERDDRTQNCDGHIIHSTDIIANTNCERKSSVLLYHLNNRSWIPLTNKEKLIKVLKQCGVDKVLRILRKK